VSSNISYLSHLPSQTTFRTHRSFNASCEGCVSDRANALKNDDTDIGPRKHKTLRTCRFLKQTLNLRGKRRKFVIALRLMQFDLRRELFGMRGVGRFRFGYGDVARSDLRPSRDLCRLH
jgi:hypothetical protein